MPSNEYYDSSGYPSTGAAGSSASMRAELDAVEAGFVKLPTMAGNGDLPVFVNAGGTALETKSAAAALTALGGENTTKKDATGGYAGLTLFKINFMNALGTVKSFFTNSNTVARTYTFPDKDGTVAMTSDITGTNSGTNTGDQIAATVANTPAGNIAATNVQAALNELDTEKAAATHSHAQADVTDLVTALSGKESSLGNPASDGQVLSSTSAGVRSWVDASTGIHLVSGLAVTGGVIGGDITKTGANELTITPTTCLDSALEIPLYTSADATLTIPSAANTIYHIFIVKLVADGSFEFRAYTTEAGVASDAQVSAYRWIGFWRTNGSSECVVGVCIDGLMLFGKASENVVSSGVTTSYAVVDHSAFIPESRISEIEYGVRDASASDSISASDDGTNVSFVLGSSVSSTADTSRSIWGAYTAQKTSLKPFNASRQFKSESGTLDLLIHQVRVRR